MLARAARRGTERSAAEIVDDPGMEGGKAFVAMLQRQRRAELRLPPGRLRKTTSWRATASAVGAPEIVLDQSEREVDPRGDARRGPDIAVADKNRIAFDGHVGIAPRQFRAAASNASSRAAGQQAGRGQQQRARTDRGEPARPRRPAARSQSSSACVLAAALTPKPPATISVSTAFRRAGAGSTARPRPAEV